MFILERQYGRQQSILVPCEVTHSLEKIHNLRTKSLSPAAAAEKTKISFYKMNYLTLELIATGCSEGKNLIIALEIY